MSGPVSSDLKKATEAAARTIEDLRRREEAARAEAAKNENPWYGVGFTRTDPNIERKIEQGKSIAASVFFRSLLPATQQRIRDEYLKLIHKMQPKDSLVQIAGRRSPESTIQEFDRRKNRALKKITQKVMDQTGVKMKGRLSLADLLLVSVPAGVRHKIDHQKGIDASRLFQLLTPKLQAQLKEKYRASLRSMLRAGYPMKSANDFALDGITEELRSYIGAVKGRLSCLDIGILNPEIALAARLPEPVSQYRCGENQMRPQGRKKRNAHGK